MPNKATTRDDFDFQAVAAANYISEHLFEAHRGGMCWHNGLLIAFGNDGYSQDENMRKEVIHLRQALLRTTRAPEELGFGLDSASGYSWAMILRPDPRTEPSEAADWLNATVWASWRHAFGDPLQTFRIEKAPRVAGIQGDIATVAIERELNGDRFR